jgi:hypothetical protein
LTVGSTVLVPGLVPDTSNAEEPDASAASDASDAPVGGGALAAASDASLSSPEAVFKGGIAMR